MTKAPSRFSLPLEEIASQQLAAIGSLSVATTVRPQSTKYHLALCNTQATFSSVQMIFAYLNSLFVSIIQWSRKNNVPLGSLTTGWIDEQRSQKDLGSVQSLQISPPESETDLHRWTLMDLSLIKVWPLLSPLARLPFWKRYDANLTPYSNTLLYQESLRRVT
jgi:hypothetical protein